MKTRIITGAVMTAVFVPVLCFADTFALPLLAAVLAAVAVYEFAKCVGMSKKYAFIPLMTIAAASPFAVRYSGNAALSILAAVCAAFLWIMICSVIAAEKQSFAGETEMCAGMIYIICGFSMLVSVHDAFPRDYLLLILAPVGCDICAYFVGSKIGKNKLCPHLSPKKTVEGAIGGVMGGVLFAAIFGLVVCLCGQEFNFLFCLLAVPVAILSQFGDLFASAVKRKYGIKDYGNIFPGHGGVLDRFDSSLPVFILAGVLTFLFV